MPARLILPALLAACLGGGLGACSGNSLAGNTETGQEAPDGSTSPPAASDTTDGADSPAFASQAADSTGRPQSVAGGRDTTRQTLVVVQPLSRGPIRDEVVVSAKVQARTEVAVFPKLSGLPITSVLVEEGDGLEAGQLLMTLYDEDLRLAEQSAQAKLDEATKELERARHKLAEADMRIARAERQAEKTEADLERVQGLVADGLINVQELEDKRLAADTAQDDLDLERFSRSDLALAADLAEIRKRQTEIAWKQAVSDLSHTRVLAPGDGVVASRDVDVGELSSMSAPAFRLVDTSQPLLNLRVPQDVLARLAAGQAVDVHSVTNAELHFSGVVRTVNPVLDQATGTVHVIVDLVPAAGLLPGLFCEARIVTAARDEALLIDKRAVLYEDDQPVFFALASDQSTVEKVSFEAGASTPTEIEVLCDAQGDAVPDSLMVVVVGQESLKDGARVKLRETAY